MNRTLTQPSPPLFFQTLRGSGTFPSVMPRNSIVLRPFRLAILALFATVVSLAVTADAATGTFVIKTKSVNETGGAWRIFTKIELPKAPLVAHQSMRFNFKKTMV